MSQSSPAGTGCSASRGRAYEPGWTIVTWVIVPSEPPSMIFLAS